MAPSTLFLRRWRAKLATVAPKKSVGIFSAAAKPPFNGRRAIAEPRTDTTRLQRMALAYAESAVLYAAMDLELFTHVAAAADTDSAVALALDITPLNVERLFTACLALGLIVRESGRLGNTPDAERFLVQDRPGYAGPLGGNRPERLLKYSQ